MALKTFRPLTPSRRRMSFAVKPTTVSKPLKRLTFSKKQNSGRNSQGRITIRRRGGESRRQFRIIDDKRNKFNIEARVATIEYDPNRTALIALMHYIDGEKRYMLLPEGVKVGDMIVSSNKRIDIKPGNRTRLANIPAGTFVHGIELAPGSGAQMVKSAGSQAVIMSKEGEWVNMKMPSGEVRKISKECAATIGQVSNIDHINEIMGKAGRNRWKGQRPRVLGKSMNPVDHPHGGGEGHQPIGLPQPRTPWGKPALGLKTRNRKKKSNAYIVKRKNA